MNRKRYIRAMLKAIDSARQPVWIGEKVQSKTNGLRVIRRFEKVNKCTFNPFDDYHVLLISGHANTEHFFSRLAKMFDQERQDK